MPKNYEQFQHNVYTEIEEVCYPERLKEVRQPSHLRGALVYVITPKIEQCTETPSIDNEARHNSEAASLLSLFRNIRLSGNSVRIFEIRTSLLILMLFFDLRHFFSLKL